ncbi:synaptopodin 2-like protein [Kryptolebias marmoratus]|uniref:Synaptopodin 2-like protein n=1 Tax=Kryptolebias marmoratus TaxID=37003 RepID=A0A3Q3AF56_KRYMA|nr:synaptopodin 2-like protein [Kryptolebias marmoratus]
MVAEEIVVSISGGAPWGFRLQGGAEHQKPLQVAKVRRHSKACRAGLKEHDELVAIGDHMCAELSHGQAMNLLDKESGTLNLKVKRTSAGFHTSSCSGRSTSPQSFTRVLSPPVALLNNSSSFLSPIELLRGVMSPPDSEAYYGETDSDADTHSHVHQRRHHRTSPHARPPARHDNQEEETSEMSGYESATDAGVTLQWDNQCVPGVPRRELVYLPHQTEWTTPAHTPHTLTPHTLTPTPDQSPVDAEGEGDSGFQEVGGSTSPACPPLVSPERVKEVLKLCSGNHLVPMVGPQQTPVGDELSTTYMDKARQAKLQRGESVVEKQVKEARSKCRSIASLLTDAPNPNSKGVLMFKKRRQRAKKYTLTCFGKAEGDKEREPETGGETEEEGGSSILSGSEVEEEGFSGSFDATWDSGYLDLLEKRSSACPSATPTTPTTPNRSTEVDISTYLTPGLETFDNQNLGLEISGLESSANHGSRVERNIKKQTIKNHMAPPAVALTNGGSVAVSRGSVVLSPTYDTPPQAQNGPHSNPNNTANRDFSPSSGTDMHNNSPFNPNPSVLNRTARPFTPGSTPRASVTSVMFRPPQPKPTPLTMAPQPVAAVSMVTISPIQHLPVPDARRAVSSTSLYIPPRNNNSNTSPSVNSPPSALSPPSSLSSTSFSQPPSTNPSPAVHASPSTPILPPVQAFSPPPYHFPSVPHSSPSTCISAPHISPANPSSGVTQVSFSTPPSNQPCVSPPAHSYNDMTATSASPAQAPGNDSLATREQRISVPAARTGILNDARCRSNKKPMFTALKSKDVSPNPDLLSMVQNMDDHFGKNSCVETAAPSGEAGHESGPEEDWLRLGAEACNFMQAQRGPRPPPVAPKPQAPQVLQLAGKGGQLFARRQNRMDRYVVERSPSVAAAPYSPAQTREPSPTPSLPATWKYSSSIRAPPPINYNPLLSPSCPPKAQKKPEVKKSGTTRSKGQKGGIKPVDIMNHQPYQLHSSLFSYGGGVPQDTSNHSQQRGGPQKTARVYEVKRFSTPPPTATGPTPKVIVPRSATTLGEPLRYSDAILSPPAISGTPFQNQHPSPQPYQPQWASPPLSPPVPPAPTAPLPQLPTFSSPPVPNSIQPPTFSQPQSSAAPQANKHFKSAPDLSPLGPTSSSQQGSSSSQPTRVPRPRFSTSNLGLQPSVWRPGSTMH